MIRIVTKFQLNTLALVEKRYVYIYIYIYVDRCKPWKSCRCQHFKYKCIRFSATLIFKDLERFGCVFFMSEMLVDRAVISPLATSRGGVCEEPPSTVQNFLCLEVK